DLNALKERLSVEFSIDINSLLEDETTADQEGDETELREKTERIKRQLDDFGAINPMAMEAYQEMAERYTFIQDQKRDLLEAKSSLLQTIQEIDDTAKEQFMDAFTKVREHFVEVFRSLFNQEDNCDLVLTDPSNPLESDIDILARPKGKRPLSIIQLSGGEKTLTATALLFSLYLLKPAPFCIFDEVDAPLDDTNIDKFNNIIKDFSKNSQFIIVSHNKRTIASTDIIYGVTMVEQGVSRVVPVDLRDVAYLKFNIICRTGGSVLFCKPFAVLLFLLLLIVHHFGHDIEIIHVFYTSAIHLGNGEPQIINHPLRAVHTISISSLYSCLDFEKVIFIRF